MQKFSVLMSVYIKEKASYFSECIESVLSQTIMPSEIVIVEDGPINKELSDLIEKYKSSRPQLFKIIICNTNRGLGPALAEGIQHCSYELVARMDTDDICVSYRFEKQLIEFEKNPNIDICGSHIKEFDGTINNIISERKVPLSHDDIAKYQKTRSAVNHMTVMYKKSSVLKAGNYSNVPLMEDDVLWVNMLINGALFINIDDYLVYARTGIEMINRRGSFDYLKKYAYGRKIILKTGYINYWDYLKTVIIQTVVALTPINIRKIIFIKILR